MDAGVILIITAREFSQDDLEIIKTTINPDKIETVWVGEDVSTDISYDLKVPGKLDVNVSVESIKQLLQDNGSIFKQQTHTRDGRVWDRGQGTSPPDPGKL